jgi:hypothetical protein
MTKFTIKQEEISRLKVFSDISGKLKNVAALNSKQLFVLSEADSKLEIYLFGEGGSAGSIQSEIKIDIQNLTIDAAIKSFFIIELDSLLTAISKILSGDISVQLTDNQIIITGPNTKSKFSNNLLVNKDETEVTEIRGFIDAQLAIPEFQNKVELNISNIKNDLVILSSLSKIFNGNELIEVSETGLKTADSFGIFSETLTAKPTSDTTYLHRDLVQLFNNIDKVDISSDKKFWFFNFASFGIRLLVVPRTQGWIYPTSSDLKDFLPDDKKIKLEINAKAFYSTLSDFIGIFDSSWTYGQVKIEVPSGFDSSKELLLSHHDELHEVSTSLPVSIVERTDTNDGFDFVIPTKGILELEPAFYKDDNSIIWLEFSSIPMSQLHGSGVKFSNSEIEISLPKMVLP